MKDFMTILAISSWILLASARPRDFYLKKNENYLRRFLKSFAIGQDELFCPRTVEGSGSIMSETGMRLECGRDYDLCSDDRDCGPGLMCCPSGCIYKCVVPVGPKTAVATDWIEEPEALTVGGNSWLIEGDEPSEPRDIECSTSVFSGIEPLQCMSGYLCMIQIQEDKMNQIPNRGICIKTTETSKPFNPSLGSFSSEEATQPTERSSCLLNGKMVPHGYHDTVNCNLCFCKDGDLFCQMQPCLTGYT